MVDDKQRFHDPLGHSMIEEATGILGWDTACVHHVDVKEMRRLRGIREWQDEWEMRPEDSEWLWR